MKTGFDRVIHVASDHAHLGCDPEAPTMRFRMLSGRQFDRRPHEPRRRPLRRETPGQAYERRRVRCQTAHRRVKDAIRELEFAIAAAERICQTLEERLAEADARAASVRRRSLGRAT